MNYEEIKRITGELKKREAKLAKLSDQADAVHCEMEELHDNLQKAIVGDISYMVFEEVPETEETLENL